MVIEQRLYGFTVNAVEGYICGIRQPSQRIAGDEGLGDALQKSFLQSIPQRFYSFVFLVHVLQGEFGRLAQTNDPGRVLCARASVALLAAPLISV